MTQIEKRLKKLEEDNRMNAASNLDRSAAVQSLIADQVKRISEMLFQLWRTKRLAAGLPAERKDYEDETAAEEAADEKAWNAHVASLSPNEREELEKRASSTRLVRD